MFNKSVITTTSATTNIHNDKWKMDKIGEYNIWRNDDSEEMDSNNSKSDGMGKFEFKSDLPHIDLQNETREALQGEGSHHQPVSLFCRHWKYITLLE